MHSMYLVENHRLVPVQQHPALRHVLHGRRQHIALDRAARMRQLLRAHRMVHPYHVLLNNRPLVQITRHKVRRGPHNLHSAVVRLVVWLGALERRQEGVVDVDDPSGHGLAQPR